MSTHRVVTTGSFYKGVTKDLQSPQQSAGRLTYTPGTTVTVDTIESDPAVDCGAGINFQRTIADALRWGPVVVRLEVPSKVPIIDTGRKLRSTSVRVIEVVDLAGANLARANLADANLADANLADANLADANLADANLADANLADAYLAGANLARAYLAGANLARANLADANLARANLAGAKGTPLGGIPAGWKLGKSGLWVKS